MGRSAVQPAAELVEFTLRARGGDGRRWLERLPALVAGCEDAFGVTALEALPGGTTGAALARVL